MSEPPPKEPLKLAEDILVKKLDNKIANVVFGFGLNNHIYAWDRLFTLRKLSLGATPLKGFLSIMRCRRLYGYHLFIFFDGSHYVHPAGNLIDDLIGEPMLFKILNSREIQPS